ncbi:MAG: hypothetical protein ACLUGF_00070 [Clostridium sp.]
MRAIYDELQKDEKFRSFYFVWAFTDPAAHFDLLENHHTILVKKELLPTADIMPVLVTGLTISQLLII